QELLDLQARGGADLLEHLAALPDEDPLLRVALHEDPRLDAHEVAPFSLGLVEGLDHHGGAVRNLLAGEAEDLFADVLRHDGALRQIGDHVRREELGPHGKLWHHLLDQPVDAIARQRGKRNDRSEIHALVPGVDERQEERLANLVDLVDAQDDRLPGPPQPPHDGLLYLAEGPAHGLGRVTARRLDDEEDDVHLLDRAERLLHHVAVQPLPRAVDARRVEEGNLGVRQGEHAQDAVSRGLRLGRDDGDLLAEQAVEQRALAHVRPADDRAEAGSVRLVRAQGSDETSSTMTFSSTTSRRGRSARFRGVRAMARTTSIPSTTSPKIVWWLLSQGVGTSVMKNCEPLVSGPALAMASSPGRSNFRPLWNSSGKT